MLSIVRNASSPKTHRTPTSGRWALVTSPIGRRRAEHTTTADRASPDRAGPMRAPGRANPIRAARVIDRTGDRTDNRTGNRTGVDDDPRRTQRSPSPDSHAFYAAPPTLAGAAREPSATYDGEDDAQGDHPEHPAGRPLQGRRQPLRSFCIRWTTSPVRDYVGVDLPDWRHANRAIAVMGHVAPISGMGLHRVWFRLTWQDGQQHRARIDLVRRPLSDLQVLSRHVHDTLAFQTGRLRPASIPLAAYLGAVAELSPEERQRAALLLDGYDLGLDGPALVPARKP